MLCNYISLLVSRHFFCNGLKYHPVYNDPLLSVADDQTIKQTKVKTLSQKYRFVKVTNGLVSHAECVIPMAYHKTNLMQVHAINAQGNYLHKGVEDKFSGYIFHIIFYSVSVISYGILQSGGYHMSLVHIINLLCIQDVLSEVFRGTNTFPNQNRAFEGNILKPSLNLWNIPSTYHLSSSLLYGVI